MKRFELYRPKSLLELSDIEIEEISPEEQQELIELILLESKEVLENLSSEIDDMSEEIFSLDSFYEIQEIIEDYRKIIDDLNINNIDIEECLQSLYEKIEKKNPISEIAKQNHGIVLIHASDLRSIENLLLTKFDVSEVCATGGSLREKGDVFRPKKKSIHAGLIFNPQQASAWFSKDVGSYTIRGKRAIEPRLEQYRCNSLEEALDRQLGERVEAWIDTQVAQPIAILLIDENERDEAIRLAKEHNFPVLFNSHLYE
jgi:hypothetical protein